MNMNPLKASLLATAIALGMGAATVSADDHLPDRSVGQTVEDATITAAVKTKLLADARTDGFDINVDTHAGVVTMTGGADNPAAKAAAAELAATVAGVVLVKNDIVVAAEGTPLRDEANTATASGELRAVVEDATDSVDEEGNNPSLADLDGDGVDEVDDANDLLGDKVDDDRLGDGTGGPSDAIDDAWITGKVKTQLLADATIKGLLIDVDTDANVVTLTGTVETAAQRDAAVRIATTTTGVNKVVADDLKIAGQ